MKLFCGAREIAVKELSVNTTYVDFLKKVKYAENYLIINRLRKVAMVMRKSCDLYALIWACYNIGATFCCIDHSLSENAIVERIENFSPDITVCDECIDVSKCCLKQDIFSNILLIEEFDSTIKYGTPNSVLFVIFTSGSTGKPKGVCVLRKAFEEVIHWAQDNIGINQSDVVGQFCKVSFDMGLCDVFLALSVGATLVPMEGMAKIKPGAFIKQFQINYIYSVPTLVDMFMANKDLEKRNLDSIKMLGFGGAALRDVHMKYISDYMPNLKVFNTYGPTETTLFTSCISFNAKDYKNITKESVCLGQPISGVEYRIHKPIDSVGELEVIGDHCLAGYLPGNIDVENAGSAMQYKTGDIVSYSEGQYYFVCRKDNQVKLRGTRIDLDGIDAYLYSKDILSLSFICENKLVVCFSGSKSTADIVRTYLSDYLPSNCMPSHIYKIYSLPLNSNGKYDRSKLIEEYKKGVLENEK